MTPVARDGRSAPQDGSVDLDALRVPLRRAADWAAEYLANAAEHPVLSRSRPGDLAAALPVAAPEAGEALSAILDDVDRLILPGITHWNHPGFLAYFANTGSLPGVVAELITAALNVNGMLWRTSPAATELEERSLDWLRQMLGLAGFWRGVITDTASMSSLLALAAAREAAVPDLRQRGLAGRADLAPLVVYASEQAHSSIDKACLALGLGLDNLRKVAVDDAFRMRPADLAAAIAADRAAGLRPMAVVATVGTTSTTSIDPVRAIAAIARREALWLHVDAAYGGAAAVNVERRAVLDGVDEADSLVVNPHKWLLVPMDCSALYLRDAERLKAAFSLVPEYLRTSDAASVNNYMDWGPQLGRRFRALKLWMVLRAYGREGLAAVIREHCRLASLLAAWIDAAPDWERLAPVPFSTVAFRHRPAALGDDEAALEAHNAGILEAVNQGGEVFLSHTRLGERYALRVAIGNAGTAEATIVRCWALLRGAATAAETHVVSGP